MPIRTTGLGHVHFGVHDPQAALTFHEAAFGAVEAFRVRDRLVFVRLDGGEVVALDGRPEPERSRPYVGLRLAEGESLGAAIDEIVRAGGTLERDEHDPGIAYAYVADPDGNVTEI
ncbi:MAG TPA: VOC family protein [Gaiellaceae bacterium]|nr:VOC family protein [Gaiellaceae bacterium]